MPLLVLVIALAACTPKAVHPTLPPRPPSHPMIAPPVARPPVALTPPPVAPPRNFDQEKARMRAALAKNPQDSLAPTEVGYYLDVLLGRIKQSAGRDIGAVRQNQKLVIVLPARAGFAVGSVDVGPGLQPSLAALVRVLVEYRRVLVVVRVRPDQSVIGASNPRLTEQRGSAIAKALADAGISPQRIAIAPAAPSHPAVAKPGILPRARIQFELEPIVRLTARPKSRT